jgi:hypothetical protein
MKTHSKQDLQTGAPKRLTEPVPHGGMHSRTRDGQLVVGVTHTTIGTQFDPTTPDKSLFGTPPAPIHSGMTNKQNAKFMATRAAGGGHEDVLREALRNSDPHHPAHDPWPRDRDLGKRILDEADRA